MKLRLAVYAVVIVAALGWASWRMRPPVPIELIVVRDGFISHEGQTLETAQLGPHVAAQLQRNPRRPVRLTVDAQAPSTTLIPVLQALERHGVVNVEVVANP